MGLKIRFVMEGKEVSFNSFVEALVGEIRASVREEISRTLPKYQHESSNSSRTSNSEMPRQAVSVREAARLLSISPRTVDKYVALKVIRTVRVGRRVLVPMKSVNEVVARGIPWRRKQRPNGEPRESPRLV